MTNLKTEAKFFKMRKQWRSSFKAWYHMCAHSTDTCLCVSHTHAHRARYARKRAFFALSYYYMAISVREQDDPNPAPWLPTPVGNMELSCSSKDNPLYPARNIPSENPYYSSLLAKLVWSRSLDDGLGFFFADLWTSTPSRYIFRQNKILCLGHVIHTVSSS